MIVEEILEENPDLIRRYSDQGMYIRQDQTGIEYSEAIDLITSNYTYTETDKKAPVYDDDDNDIPEDEPQEEPPYHEHLPYFLNAQEALDIILGGEE